MKKVWARDELVRKVREHWTPLQELTLGIVGHGRIGRRLAQAAQGLGMRGLALRSHPRPEPPTNRLPTQPALRGRHRFSGGANGRAARRSRRCSMGTS